MSTTSLLPKSFLKQLTAFFDLLQEIAACRVRAERLRELHVPKASIHTAENHKTYRNKNGEQVSYTYTNQYIYLYATRKQYYIPKKGKSMQELRFWELFSADLDALRCLATDKGDKWYSFADGSFDRDNATVTIRRRLHLSEDTYAEELMHLFVRRIWFGAQNRRTYKEKMLKAERLCAVLNAARPKQIPYFDFEELMEAQYKLLCASPLYGRIRAEIDNEDYEDPTEEDRPHIYNRSCIELDEKEWVRSRNELIILKCLQDNGYLYAHEPKYCFSKEGKQQNADFLLLVPGGPVYLEIAGMMDDPDYAAKMQFKREQAKKGNIRQIIFDMTEDRTRCLQFSYQKISEILQKIRLGLQPCQGEMLRPA